MKECANINTIFLKEKKRTFSAHSYTRYLVKYNFVNLNINPLKIRRNNVHK